MDSGTYNAISNFLRNGRLPSTFRSTKGNFINLANLHDLNSKGSLLREGKPVVKANETEKIWNQFHKHQGSIFKLFLSLQCGCFYAEISAGKKLANVFIGTVDKNLLPKEQVIVRFAHRKMTSTGLPTSLL